MVVLKRVEFSNARGSLDARTPKAMARLAAMNRTMHEGLETLGKDIIWLDIRMPRTAPTQEEERWIRKEWAREGRILVMEQINRCSFAQGYPIRLMNDLLTTAGPGIARMLTEHLLDTMAVRRNSERLERIREGEPDWGFVQRGKIIRICAEDEVYRILGHALENAPEETAKAIGNVLAENGFSGYEVSKSYKRWYGLIAAGSAVATVGLFGWLTNSFSEAASPQTYGLFVGGCVVTTVIAVGSAMQYFSSLTRFLRRDYRFLGNEPEGTAETGPVREIRRGTTKLDMGF